MSKSDASDYSRINLSDDAETIAQKIRKAKTDPQPLPGEPEGLAGRPEAENLVGIYGAISGRDAGDVLREFGGAPFSRFKNDLTELLVAKIAPVGAEMKRLQGDPAEIDRILVAGADRARSIAAPTMDAVKEIVGFVKRHHPAGRR
jgi:tryptophanyl-tRNA synthetase